MGVHLPLVNVQDAEYGSVQVLGQADNMRAARLI